MRGSKIIAVMAPVIVLPFSACTTSMYVQLAGDERREVEEYVSRWPVGNICRLNADCYEEVKNSPDDYVLPPSVDKALNYAALTLAWPFSLVSDILFSPYQLVRYYARDDFSDIAPTRFEDLQRER